MRWGRLCAYSVPAVLATTETLGMAAMAAFVAAAVARATASAEGIVTLADTDGIGVPMVIAGDAGIGRAGTGGTVNDVAGVAGKIVVAGIVNAAVPGIVTVAAGLEGINVVAGVAGMVSGAGAGNVSELLVRVGNARLADAEGIIVSVDITTAAAAGLVDMYQAKYETKSKNKTPIRTIKAIESVRSVVMCDQRVGYPLFPYSLPPTPQATKAHRPPKPQRQSKPQKLQT